MPGIQQPGTFKRFAPVLHRVGLRKHSRNARWCADSSSYPRACVLFYFFALLFVLRVCLAFRIFRCRCSYVVVLKPARFHTRLLPPNEECKARRKRETKNNDKLDAALISPVATFNCPSGRHSSASGKRKKTKKEPRIKRLSQVETASFCLFFFFLSLVSTFVRRSSFPNQNLG